MWPTLGLEAPGGGIFYFDYFIYTSPCVQALWTLGTDIPQIGVQLKVIDSLIRNGEVSADVVKCISMGRGPSRLQSVWLST